MNQEPPSAPKQPPGQAGSWSPKDRGSSQCRAGGGGRSSAPQSRGPRPQSDQKTWRFDIEEEADSHPVGRGGSRRPDVRSRHERPPAPRVRARRPRTGRHHGRLRRPARRREARGRQRLQRPVRRREARDRQWANAQFVGSKPGIASGSNNAARDGGPRRARPVPAEIRGAPQGRSPMWS